MADHDKQFFEKILARTAEEIDLQVAIRNLMRYIHQHFNVKPYLLIDEYDTPIISAYTANYYPEMINLVRGEYWHWV